MKTIKKNEDDLTNEDDIKNEDDLKNGPPLQNLFATPTCLPEFFLMTSHCNSNTTTDVKPEMIPGV